MATRKIEDLLHRRTDLSTFLVHLTRTDEERTACDNLVSILQHGLQAVTEYGMAKNRGVPNQKVVCFTETLLEQVWTMLERIENRDILFEPYGVVFTKVWARRKGANPVWYIDMSVGADGDWLTRVVDRLVDDDVASDNHQGILQLTPFFEQMGTWSGNRKEFWWEREWRIVGDLHFSWHELVAVLAPEDSHENIGSTLSLSEIQRRKFLDPAWGLERMISALSDIPSDNAGPLPERVS